MDKSAAKAASNSLVKAQASLAAMKNSKRSEEFQQAWSDFLLAAHRIFSKLEQGSKTSGTSKAWFGRQVHERRTDPLLAYIHHARNTDEHGLAEISSVHGRKLGAPSVERVLSIGPNFSRYRLDNVTLVPVEIIPSSAKMFPVVDSGRTYDPPTEHRGVPIKDPSPIVVGELAVSFLQDMVAQAHRLP